MKKVALLSCLTISILLTACGHKYVEETTYVEENETYAGGYFIVEKKWDNTSGKYYIVYAKDTGVKYLVIIGGNRYGITPLYNADGSLQISEKFKEE